MIVRTPTGIGVGTSDRPPTEPRLLLIEVEHQGRKIKADFVSSYEPWRDYYPGIDMMQCVVRVREGQVILAELGLPDAPLPWMVLQGEQRHITESYVSIPPALTITDEGGHVWTLGFVAAPPEKSPHGEFAFEVLMDGRGMGEIASRIERRGKVRIFTKGGWKTWNGSTFF